MMKRAAKCEAPDLSNTVNETDVSGSAEQGPMEQGNKRAHKRARASSLAVRAKAARQTQR
jgi:hypothetical protein